jgi:peptidoglycan/LPS O-acetylase OafA/YrhL
MPGLDGVRAIAVVAVLVFHLDPTWLPGGFLGVDVFFTLSGFLITSLLLAELDATGGLRFGRFYLRRARRLLPALFLVLVATALLAVTVAQDAAERVREDAVAAFFYVTNWWYVLHGTSYFEATGRPPMLQHLWSLAVEEQFYFIWPLLLYGLWRLGRRRGVQVGAIAGALLSTVAMVLISVRSDIPDLTDPSRVYFGTDTHAMTLLVGAALATFWAPGRVNASLTARGSKVVTAVGATGLLGLVAIFVLVGPGSTSLYRGGFLVVGIVTAMVVAAAGVTSTLFARGMARQPLTYLGQRSYGIYLWHWPIFLVLRPGIDLDADGWPVQVLRIALTLAAAELSYRFVEMPIRRGALGRAWRSWRARGTRTTVTRSLLAGAVAVGVVASLGIGLTSAKVPTLEDDLGGVTAIGDDPLVPTTSPSPGASGSTPPPPRVPPVRPRGVDAFGLSSTATGDSVLLAASEAMQKTFPGMTIDAQVSRQSRGVFARIKARKDAGKLGDVVVISTGTNGTVLASDLTAMLTLLSDRSRVVLVTPKAPRSWVDKNISIIKSVAATFPNARVADWNTYARGHRDWFYADGIHTKGAGSQAYAALIRETMRS